MKRLALEAIAVLAAFGLGMALRRPVVVKLPESCLQPAFMQVFMRPPACRIEVRDCGTDHERWLWHQREALPLPLERIEDLPRPEDITIAR
jgi:hypothetical protein